MSVESEGDGTGDNLKVSIEIKPLYLDLGSEANRFEKAEVEEGVEDSDSNDDTR